MRDVYERVISRWGNHSQLNIAQYLSILSMSGILPFLPDSRIGLYPIPPFGATLTILLVMPDALTQAQRKQTTVLGLQCRRGLWLSLEPAPTMIARFVFLRIPSGQGQLHASRYLSRSTFFDPK